MFLQLLSEEKPFFRIFNSFELKALTVGISFYCLKKKIFFVTPSNSDTFIAFR